MICNQADWLFLPPPPGLSRVVWRVYPALKRWAIFDVGQRWQERDIFDGGRRKYAGVFDRAKECANFGPVRERRTNEKTT